MDRDRLRSGIAFRAMVRAGMVFLLVLVLAGAVAFGFVRQTLLSAERQQISSELLLLADIHHDSGVADTIVALNQLVTSLELTHQVAGLFDADGGRLAGNMATDPGVRDWGRAQVDVLRPGLWRTEPSGLYYLGTHDVEGGHLVVGRSLDTVNAVERRVIGGILAFGLTVTLAALAIGYALSHRTQVKLDAMAGALDAVSRGDLTARVPVAGEDDQIDRVADRMNAQLDRLAVLVAEARRTAAAIAHDLRTPLSRAWLGLDEAAAQAASGADAGDAIAASQADLARLNGIIETVLRIARIEAGADAAADRVDLAALARDMAETFAPVAEDAGRVLDCDLEEVWVEGDAGMLQQVLANLLQNAITHAGQGARITVSSRNLPDGATLSVSDTGPGIPEAERGRVLDAFYRGDAARSSAGSGLGLALVRAVAERHGAALELSDANPGLCVTLKFPT